MALKDGVAETAAEIAIRLAEEETARLAAEGGDDDALNPDTPEPPDPDPDNPPEPGADDDAEVIVTIGDNPNLETDEDIAAAPEWVRELRKNHREAQRENRELKQKLESVAGATIKPPELGEKPKLEDFDYKADEFGTALEAWHEKKLEVDAAARKKQDDERTAQAAWQIKLDAYGTAKAKLKVKDVAEVEAVAQEILTVTQQGVVLHGADNPALVIYALGKNPKKCRELAAIKDPVKFAFAVSKLETQLKVTPRKAPPPEDRVLGSAPRAGGKDSQLERLRAEADKSGDYTKVTAYKRKQRQPKT